MALDFYSAYIRSMAVTPKQEWTANYQAALDDFWDNTNTVETIQAQKAVGSKEFEDEQVQLTSTAIGNTGTHIGDFWRKIIHKNQAEATNYLGKYYLIDGEWWLTVNTNTVIGAVKDSVLRYCNQTLNWVDKNGAFHSWACVLDENKLTYTNPDVGTKEVSQVAADMVMLVQQNAETRAIPINQRFVFDGKAYQVKQVNPHICPTYLMVYLNATQWQEGDDAAEELANSTAIAPQNGIRILPQEYKIKQSQTQEYSVYVYQDGEPTDTEFTINAEYDETKAVFTVIDGNHFSITNIVQSNTPIVVTCVPRSEIDTPSISIEQDALIIDDVDERAQNYAIFVNGEEAQTISNPYWDGSINPETATITITLGGAY